MDNFNEQIKSLTRQAIHESLDAIATAMTEKFGISRRGRDQAGWLIEWLGDDRMPLRWWHPVKGYVLDASDSPRFARFDDAEIVRKGNYILDSLNGIG